MIEKLSDFPVTVKLPVQWGDQDAYGHVNNVVYFRWYETARIAYFTRLRMHVETKPQRLGPILASIRCDYRQQLTFPDFVHIGARVTRIGRTSVTLEHQVYSEALSEIAALAESVVVIFDYQEQRPHPVPDEMRQAIAAVEGKEFR